MQFFRLLLHNLKKIQNVFALNLATLLNIISKCMSNLKFAKNYQTGSSHLYDYIAY